MAKIIIDIPDAIAARVTNGFCKRYGYQELIGDATKKNDAKIPNPETKGQFIKRRVIEFIKRAVRDAEIEEASKRAADTAADNADTDIVLS